MRHERWRLPAATIATVAKFRGRISLKVYLSVVKTKWKDRRRPAHTQQHDARPKNNAEKIAATRASTSQSPFRLHLGFTGIAAPITTALSAFRQPLGWANCRRAEAGTPISRLAIRALQHSLLVTDR
jgi:hypothetical protein